MQKLFFNGQFYDGVREEPRRGNLLVEGERIKGFFDSRELQPNLDQKGEKIDLEGAIVTPGLIDGHTHFMMFSQQLLSFRFSHCKSLQEALDVVAAGIKENPRIGGWLLGGGWDHNFWPEGLPDRQVLDKVTGDIPAAFFSKDHHSLWVNSAALERAGIGPDTPTPAGGEIVREEDGRPAGVLMENANDLILEIIPPPSLEVAVEALEKGMENAASLGLTGVHTFEGFRALQALQQMQRQGRLKMRFLMGIPTPQLEAALEVGLSSGIGNEYLRLGHLKMFLDGALGSQTAAMIEPYTSNPDYRGIPTMEEDEFSRIAKKAIDHGLGLAIHAIGDRVNRLAVDVLEKNQEQTRYYNLRHRIEHAQLLQPREIKKIGELQIIPSMQPVHLKSDQELIERHWGEERGRWAYACRSLLDSGAQLVLGTDAPVETIDPREGLYYAIFRRGQNMEEAITAHQALRAYTYGPAYAAGEEKIKGTLEKGKLADMTVFSSDFLQDPEQLKNVEILGTVVGGELVYWR